jgi:(p)ppGpp synthase/HD superfamily hydrolase
MNNYQLYMTIGDVLAAVAKHHTIYPEASIKKAYEFAKEKHKNVKRGTGEDFILHPLRVAYKLASAGCECSWIIAALLHDIVEDVDEVSLADIEDMFGGEVARIVDGVTKIDKRQPPYDKLTRNEVHKLTDVKLLSTKNDASVMVKLADREDNLHTIEGLPEAKRIEKAKHTMEMLVPLAGIIGAEKIESELEELCFPIIHPEETKIIERAFEEYKKGYLCSANKTIEIFKEIFCPSTVLETPADLNNYRKYVVSFAVKKRTKASLYRYVISQAKNINTDFEKLLEKNKVAWYDMTLVIKNNLLNERENVTATDIFYKCYEDVLMSRGIYVLDTRMTTRNESRYMLIRDMLGNNFRLFVKSEKEYARYEVGNIIESYNNVSFANVNMSDPSDTYNKKITVFSRNGAPFFIDAGATVLDFAFMIHSDIGIHFKYALLNDTLTQMQPYEKLCHGDKVNIITDDENETADINWFRYLKTSEAVQKLLRYISQSAVLLKMYNKAKEKEEKKR